MGLPIVAILGRPNVGKSTLFNRLGGSNRAVVDEIPGVTRDRNYAKIRWNDRGFIVVDTGGLVIDSKEKMQFSITKQAEIAAGEADMVLFMIEKTLTPEDSAIAKKIRKAAFPVMLVVNKVDKGRDDLDALQAWELGLGEPLAISAKSGRNVGDMMDALIERLPEHGKGEEAHSEIRVSVIGKPNVGKSSFVNRLLGEEKLVVDDIPGTTRDAIDTPFKYNGKQWLLTDTAGLLRKQHGLDFYSSLRTVSAIKRSDIVFLLIDAAQPFTTQDKRIAGMAMDFYKGLIIGINKWDLVEAGDKTAAHLERDIKLADPFLGFVPFITLSALTGLRVRKVLEKLEMVAAERGKRIETSEVNRVIEKAVSRIPPPIVMGKRANILFATQERADPPVFIFFCREAKFVPSHYKRYLTNSLRREFVFEGVPLKMVFRERRVG